MRADQTGITQTLRKHNLSHSVFLRWKHQFNSGGAGSLTPQYHKTDPELKALQDENARLKKIIGNQALELESRQSFKKNKCSFSQAIVVVTMYINKGIATSKIIALVSGKPQQFLL